MELLVIIGILVTLAAMTIPVYTQYLVRSDLKNANQIVSQGLARAKLLAVSGQNADSWGFAASGVIFRGKSFATRDTSYDQLFLIPANVTATGVLVVVFAQLTGYPSKSGNIILQSYGLQSQVSVTRDY
ncbi:MAG: hypothetical protein JWM56_1067 [Candidatus Peribacteria bacterium]|nr:hypothetical protein [Candidatus Peribacteria bacterium]